jgi:hypothetical protein
MISGGALLGLALLYFRAAWDLPAGRDEPGPGFLPILLSLSLALVALWILVGGLKKQAVLGTNAESGAPPKPWKTILALGLTAVFAATFHNLGFAISTWLYTLFVTLLFRRDRLAFPLVVPVFTTAAIYLLFEVGLGVRLPRGPIPWN